MTLAFAAAGVRIGGCEGIHYEREGNEPPAIKCQLTVAHKSIALTSVSLTPPFSFITILPVISLQQTASESSRVCVSALIEIADNKLECYQQHHEKGNASRGGG